MPMKKKGWIKRMPIFDPNSFKKNVKEWIRQNPDGTLNELVDYCEEQVPPALFAANQWLIEQTKSWYRHILDSRKAMTGSELNEDDEKCA